MTNNKSVYDYERDVEELLDDALNNLKPEYFQKLLDDISMIISDYE